MTPHGTPDWGFVGPRQQVYGLDDMGEAVVRLGSPVVYDRRGDLLFYEDWDEGLNRVTLNGAGTGWSVDLTPDNTVHGPFCARLTAGSTSLCVAFIEGFAPIQYDSALGLEVWFTLGEDVKSLRFVLVRVLNGVLYEGSIQMLVAGGVLAYWDAVGEWTTIVTGLSLGTLANQYYVLKLVVDFATHNYVRVIWNGVTYLLTECPIYQTPGSGADLVKYSVMVFSDTAANAKVQVGLIIGTQNEPI